MPQKEEERVQRDEGEEEEEEENAQEIRMAERTNEDSDITRQMA